MHILASLISLLLLALAAGVITVMVHDHWDRIAAALAGAEIPRQVTAEIVRLRVEDGMWRGAATLCRSSAGQSPTSSARLCP